MTPDDNSDYLVVSAAPLLDQYMSVVAGMENDQDWTCNLPPVGAEVLAPAAVDFSVGLALHNSGCVQFREVTSGLTSVPQKIELQKHEHEKLLEEIRSSDLDLFALGFDNLDDGTGCPVELEDIQMPHDKDTAASVLTSIRHVDSAYAGALADKERVAVRSTADSRKRSVKRGRRSNLENVTEEFKCDYANCGRVYLKSSHLKMHLRRHTGEKPFRCSWEGCNWRFSRSDELNRHFRSHTGVKPYQCEICNKKFGRSDHLAKHRKVHERSGSQGYNGILFPLGQTTAHQVIPRMPPPKRGRPRKNSVRNLVSSGIRAGDEAPPSYYRDCALSE